MAEIRKMGYCVNGEWKESKAEKYMDVTDSSTGEVIAQVPCCTPDEVEEAIASAQAAFPEWSSLSLAKRQQYMFRWRDVLYAHKEELSELCAKELGKNIKEARGDVQKAIEPTEEACALPAMIQGDAAMQVTTGYDTATYRKPLGVTAGIVPMNFPAMIPWGWMVPLSIACGNTVVLKASSQTPLTSMRIMELFYTEGRFPKGVVNLVTCSRVEADILLTDERVKAVTFVGTTGVGKQVYSKAAAHGKRVQAQCEAKNHALVLDGRNVAVPGYENGFFVGPTILDHVTPEMTVGNREIFGPVTCIKRVKDYEEGIKIMNANPFANGSCIFTQSGYYSRKFAMETDGGMVGINVGIPVPTAYFPFSGNKDSFFGDLHVLGKDGYRFFTRAKTVTTHWFDEAAGKRKVGTWEGSTEA